MRSLIIFNRRKFVFTGKVSFFLFFHRRSNPVDRNLEFISESCWKSDLDGSSLSLTMIFQVNWWCLSGECVIWHMTYDIWHFMYDISCVIWHFIITSLLFPQLGWWKYEQCIFPFTIYLAEWNLLRNTSTCITFTKGFGMQVKMDKKRKEQGNA